MSLQSKFKIKRPHSPDHIGIHNYKKQRLLFDLENLSLHDDKNLQRQHQLHNSRRYPQRSNDSSVDDIYIPYATSSHPLKLLQNDNSVLRDSDLLYSKLKKLARDEALQMIKWVDMQHLVYTQWFQWFQKHFIGEGFGNTIFGSRSSCDMDGDIDMDD